MFILLSFNAVRGGDMQTYKLGNYQWHIEAENPQDFWMEVEGGPDGSPALIGRAFPGKEGRWVSQAIDVEEKNAYMFSALIKSELNSAQGRLELLFLDEVGNQKAIFTSKTIFLHHNWSRYKVVGIAPEGTKKAILRLAVLGTEMQSSGQIRMSQPSFGKSVLLKASFTSRGNIIILPNKPILKISLEGFAPEKTSNLYLQVQDFFGQSVYQKEINLKGNSYSLEFPQLEPGYYTLFLKAEADGLLTNEEEVSFGVITPLPKDFNPKESPICLDAGMSWSYAPDEERLDLACYLCEIAGIGLLRDRLWWGEVEKEEGKFQWGRYLQSAKAQERHKITVYQIFHDCPNWASVTLQNGGKASNLPPRDPIYVYRMVNRLVKDLGKQVRYFEVWNEPNIGFFNGRPEDYAAILKAAYLGAKDADPLFGILIGSAAGTPGEFYERVYENDVGGYFDICNQHWYGSPEELFNFIPNEVLSQLRRFGLDKKPIWITEMGMRAYPSENGDFKPVERQQASYLVRAYASAFANGISRFFYFYLCEFLEGSVSLWGIVRSDLTPKPTYIALANLIRQLGEAKCIGWKKVDDVYLVAFKRKNGENLLIIWGKEGEKLTLTAKGPVVDIMGRITQKGEARSHMLQLNISSMPIYVRGLSERDIQNLKLTPPLPSSDWKPAPDQEIDKKRVWLQLEVNPDEPRTGEENEKWGAFIEPDKPFKVTAWVNNYSDSPTTVSLTCLPDEMFILQGESTAKLEVAPWQRARYDFILIGENIVQGEKMGVSVILETKHHKEKGRVYLQSRSSNIRAKKEKIIWEGEGELIKNHSTTTELSFEKDENVKFGDKPSLKIEALIKSPGDAWVFPQIHLPADLDLSEFKGIEIWSYVGENEEKNLNLQLQLVEEDGGTYILPILRSFREAGWRRDIALLSSAQPTSWGPDPDGKLELSKVRTILLGWGGYSGKVGEKVVFYLGKVSSIDW